MSRAEMQAALMSFADTYSVTVSQAVTMMADQLDTPEDAVSLHEREILYAPDFVINAGGLINVYNELTGDYNQDRTLRMTRGIYLNLMRVFQISKDDKIPTYVAADRMAEERIEKIRGLGARHWGRFISNHQPETG